MNLNWLNYRFLPYDGYGKYGLRMVRALAQTGEVNVHPMTVDEYHQYPAWMHNMRGVDWSRLNVALMPPHEIPPLPGRIWAYTMHEGLHLRAGWADRLNETERVIVPAEWHIDMMRAEGVTAPIHVVPGGVCPDEFPALPKNNGNGHVDRPYTFLAFGDRASRKGWDLVYRAFFKAFNGAQDGDAVSRFINGETGRHALPDDVRLVVKARPGSLQHLRSMVKPFVIWEFDAENMNAVYPQADCAVIPTRGEGWGFFGREAAAMGLPVIASSWTGHAPDAPHWAIPLEKSTIVPSISEYLGKWFEADVDEIAEKMRWCYEHRAEAQAKGQEAAQWLRENQTWTHSAQRFLDVMEQHA